MNRLIFIIPLIFVLACEPTDEVYFGEQDVEGFKPIYVDTKEAFDISILAAQPIENAGKLYLYGNLLLINEIGKGIHMIDNYNPVNPIKMAFIKIPGSNDMVIKNNMIYANNYQDLIAIKITANNEVEVTERIKDIIPHNNLYPLDRGFYFECVDPAKGVVIGWQRVMLSNPQCYR